MIYPNQRWIKITKQNVIDKGRPSTDIYVDTTQKAMQNLSASAFKVYIALILNKNGHRMDYSPECLHQITGLCRATASKSLKELQEKGYLILANNSEKLFYFYDIPEGESTPTGKINSVGEQNIYTILTEHNIKFYFDFPYFKDLLSEKNNPLRYDFILINDNNPYRLIEMDSPYHETNEEIKRYDTIKNEYALSHNIPLVRIPYKERDHITLEMIMGDKYLIKPFNG